MGIKLFGTGGIDHKSNHLLREDMDMVDSRNIMRTVTIFTASCTFDSITLLFNSLSRFIPFISRSILSRLFFICSISYPIFAFCPDDYRDWEKAA